MDVPVAAKHMVAALYSNHKRLRREDLDAHDQIWGQVGVIIAMDGMYAVEKLAGKIFEEERSATLDAPDWLAYCRRRVAEVIEHQWETAKHRCHCGHATNDAAVFDDHLTTTDDDQPEHFEVLDGWTLQQVRDWQESTTTALGERQLPYGDALILLHDS
jgi:hypothetical protein